MRGITPTDAHHSLLALYGRVLLAVAARRQDDLPGLTEVCQDDLLVTSGGTKRAVHGWLAPSAWRYGDRHVHELFINADRRLLHPGVSGAENTLVTLLHEACHAWAQANGIQDTSRQGRWHNRKFTDLARKIGLVAEPDGRIGHTTPSLTSWARNEYADLLSELESGLVLAREPRQGRRLTGPGSGQPPSGVGVVSPFSQYVSASCGCQVNGRPVTIRIAKGYWPRIIFCDECQSPFS